MTGLQHRDMTGGRWWTLTLAEQLGHIGSEISRASSWRSRNAETARGALHRALELFDLTLADPRLKPSRARLREIARAREVVADYFAGGNVYGSTAASLQRYFDQFALAARRASR
jgi:hypothetical protein